MFFTNSGFEPVKVLKPMQSGRPSVWHSFALWVGKPAVKMKISKLIVVINNPFKCGRLQAETMLTGES